MRTAVKIAALSVAASSVVMASGWRIPEQSMASMGSAGAYVANAKGADASYFNPANMSFNKDSYQFEADLNYIYLGGVDYKDNADENRDAASKSEDFFLPALFLSSKEYDGWRFGVNVVVPGGLSKRWDDAYQQIYAKEFTFEIVEFNPVVSYKVLPNLAVGAGARLIYSHGVVKNDLSPVAAGTSREMEGETFEYGYNLALSYKPVENLTFAATYRSNVDLEVDGNAKIYLSGVKTYDGGANVTVPLPAVLALATSYTFESETTVEFEYDRTYWSKYKELDFNYNDPIAILLKSSLDDAKVKNWNDSDAYRLCVTQKVDKFTLRVAVAYDKTAIPSDKVSFELPSNDAYIFAFGAEYQIDKTQRIGMGYLDDRKKDREVLNPEGGVNGKFSNMSAHLLSFGYSIDF